MIAVLSVESTGTHFAQYCVERLTGLRLPWGAKGHEGFVQHVYPEGVNHKADALIRDAHWERMKIVVPMRHPVKALITNYEHTRTTQRHPNPLEDHALSFGRVAAWRDVFFLQVEQPDFKGLARYLSVEPQVLPTGPMNETPERIHSELRGWLENGEWDRLNEELNGAVGILRFYSGFFRLFGYQLGPNHALEACKELMEW